MKPRPNQCCPVCGHPVGTKRLFWRAWIWARWNCESCGTLLRFDFRKRLLCGLLTGLLYMVVFGAAVACLVFRISPWIWAVPLLAAYIFGFIFIFRHGDRIAVVTPSAKDDSHALSNDA
jgi:hypothetical protein